MNLDNIELENFKKNFNDLLEEEFPVIGIEKGAKEEVLIELNEYLKLYPHIHVNISCDLVESSKDGIIKNMKIVNFLSNVERLGIFISSSIPLKDISELGSIKNLKVFSFGGYHDIKNWEILKKFYNIEGLRMNNISFRKKDYFLMNQRLKKLEIRKLDLALIERNEELEYLAVSYQLINEKLIFEKYPNLKKLRLVDCKAIKDFNFLSPLSKLEILSFNYVPHLISFPEIESRTIKQLDLLYNKSLENISAIYSLTKLKNLSITGSKVDFQEIEKIAHTMKLSYFYFVGTKIKEQEKFDEMASSIGFINSHVSFPSFFYS